MKINKRIILLVLSIFLLSITSVSASEILTDASSDELVSNLANGELISSASSSELDTQIVREDINQTETSLDTIKSEENLGISNYDDKLALTDNEEIIIEESNPVTAPSNPGTYSVLCEEIGSGGNIELQHDYYTYDSGSTINITVANSVIDGKGAVIDMAGSNIQAFRVTVSGVTIKNLTIKCQL